MILSIIAIIYTSFIALAQTNMKKMIAYSSVAHMGYVTAGIFSMNILGLDGGIFQMLSHGLISSGLFLIIGVLYSRIHSKEISVYGGIAVKMPRFAFLFMIFVLASIGFFVIMNPQLFFELSILWIIGAVSGAFITLEVGTKMQLTGR